MSVHVLLSDRLYVRGLPPHVVQELVEKHTVPNPAYIRWLRARQNGKWKTVEAPEQEFALWAQLDENCWSFPLPTLASILEQFPNTVVQDERVAPSAGFRVRQDFKPWGHQEEAVQTMLAHQHGSVVSGTGSGKTKMMGYLAGQLGLRTLFVTPSVDLMYQAKTDLLEVLDLPAERVGLYGDRRKKLADLTIATVQTLFCADLQDLKNYFGTVIFDEVDMYPMAWRKVLWSFAAKYRYGDTATYVRADKAHQVLDLMLGGVRYTVPRGDLLEQGVLVRPTIRPIQTGCTVKRNYSPEERLYLLKDLSRNKSRTKFVAQILRTVYEAGENVRLVALTELVDHVEELGKELADLNPVLYHGELGFTSEENERGKKVRRKPTEKLRKRLQSEAMDRILAGQKSITLSTYQSLARGKNVPPWNVLGIVMPFMSSTRASQVLGRIMRSSPGKKGAVVLDFQDDPEGCDMIGRMNSARNRVYKELSN